MLEIACHAWAYNNLPLTEAVGTIARLGFRNIDLGTGPHIDVMNAAKQPKSEAERIRHLLEEFNLAITDLYLMLPFINAPDQQKRDGQLLLLEKLVPFAEELGTPGITVSPGIVHGDGQDHSLARSVPALQRIMDITEDNDLRISFEPHMDSVATTPENIMLLIEAVPGLSLTIDFAHFVAQDVDWEQIRGLYEYAAHVQLRQATSGHLQTPFDEGSIDMASLVGELLQADYHGALSIEYMTTVGWHGMMEVSTTREAVKTRDVLRETRSRLLAAKA